MIEIEPYIPTPKEMHEDDLCLKEECYRFYADQRRNNCSYSQLLDLWLLAPYCEDCINNDPFEFNRIPEITADQWEYDLSWEVGADTLERIQKILKEDEYYTLNCHRCNVDLAPWNGDEVYVVRYHLEEHYGIPLYTPNKKTPPRRLREQIFSLYDNECFKCKTSECVLHIDHIRPRSKGGDAAFRNLQPLCERCGNIKGDSAPEVIEIFNTSYFEPYPSESYEYMFW